MTATTTTERDPGKVQAPVLGLLRDLHEELRIFLRQERHAGDSVGVNAKGHRQRAFDVDADRWIRDWITAHFPGGVIESEETTSPVAFGDTDAGFRFVIDPIDGSDNLARRLPLSAVTIALLPVTDGIVAHGVTHALIGDPVDEQCYVASRHEGAFWGGRSLTTSGCTEVADAMISFELNHWAGNAGAVELMKASRGVRCYGCASRALSLVATGALDAYIDTRNRLTAESFLAGLLLVTEAGGYVCTADGHPLATFESLTQTTTLVAAATRDLAERIVAKIGSVGGETE